MMQPADHDAPLSVLDARESRPWRVELKTNRICPTCTVQSWFFRLVKPRKSDCVMMLLGIACFLGSASLEVYGLVYSEYGAAHPALVIAGMIIGALLLASCCMGALVWFKGPEWAEEGTEAAWAEPRPRRQQLEPQMMGSVASGGGDDGSESEDEEGALLHRDEAARHAPAVEFEDLDDEFCYNCLLDECTVMVGAIVGMIAVGIGLTMGYEIAAALHNEQLLSQIFADPDGTVSNVTLAALAAALVAPPPSRHPLASTVPAAADAHGAPPRGGSPLPASAQPGVATVRCKQSPEQCASQGWL